MWNLVGDWLSDGGDYWLWLFFRDSPTSTRLHRLLIKSLCRLPLQLVEYIRECGEWIEEEDQFNCLKAVQLTHLGEQFLIISTSYHLRVSMPLHILSKRIVTRPDPLWIDNSISQLAFASFLISHFQSKAVPVGFVDVFKRAIIDSWIKIRNYQWVSKLAARECFKVEEELIF